MINFDRRSIGLAVSLSALGGYVDALGFLSLGNFFVSFMSGNSTRLGIAVGQGNLSYAFTAFGVVALFVTGVVLGSVLGHLTTKRRPVVLVLVATLLALAATFHGVHWPHIGTAFILLRMGAENMVFHRDGEVSIGVTYMTGTLVKLGERLAGISRGGSKTAWFPYALLWLGLIARAALGGLSHSRSGMQGLWLASAAALCLARFAVTTQAASETKPKEAA